jgi:hypothetical protein
VRRARDGGPQRNWRALKRFPEQQPRAGRSVAEVTDPSMLSSAMRHVVTGLSLVVALACLSACDRGGSGTATVTPEPIDSLKLYDTYGELLMTVLANMRAGDIAATRASIATAGQVETLCPGYTPMSGGPYDAGPLEVAVPHCVDVFGKIPEEAVAASLASHEYGLQAVPQPDQATERWAETCPDVKFFTLYGIFEVHGEGLPQAGLEVNGIFTYQGKWGLMNIPRCRGEGE